MRDLQILGLHVVLAEARAAYETGDAQRARRLLVEASLTVPPGAEIDRRLAALERAFAADPASARSGREAARLYDAALATLTRARDPA